MIQDIAPHELDIHMSFAPPKPDDALVVLRQGAEPWSMEVMLAERDGQALLPSFGMLGADEPTTYAFSIDGRPHRLALPGHGIDAPFEGFEFTQVSYIRRLSPKQVSFAVTTAMHLFKWYAVNRFCGTCGAPMGLFDKERALACPSCGALVFPRIAPVVIAAVVHDGKLLLTRYAGPRGRSRALVAGFVEIGETPEQAVAREVMEECGLAVRDVRYVGSQPWGMGGELMLGYTAELDGDAAIHVDHRELANAEWVAPEDVFETDEDFALTNDLIIRFKEGRL